MRNRKIRRKAEEDMQQKLMGYGQRVRRSGKHIEVLSESKWRLKRSVDRKCRLYF